jgi:hypothetical protein
MEESVVKLARKWRFARKLRELGIERGLPYAEAETAVDCALAVLLRSKPDKPLTPASVFTLNVEAEDFRALLGVNLFNDTLWYNKEKIDAALRYAELYASLTPGANGEVITRAVKKIKAAEKKAGYKLGELIRLIR